MDSTWGPYLATAFVGLMGVVGTIYAARHTSTATVETAKIEATKETVSLINKRDVDLYAEHEKMRRELREELEQRTARNLAAVADLQRDLDERTKETNELRVEVDKLSGALTILTLENQQLRGDNLRLTREVAALRVQVNGATS